MWAGQTRRPTAAGSSPSGASATTAATTGRAWGSVEDLAGEPVAQFGHAVAERSRVHERHRLWQPAIEQRLAVADDDRHDGQMQLVEQARVSELGGDVAAADDPEGARAGAGDQLIVELGDRSV